MTAMPAFQHGFFVSDVKAATQKGSLATKVTGTWSYEADNATHTQTNESLFANLPTLANKGNTPVSYTHLDVYKRQRLPAKIVVKNMLMNFGEQFIREEKTKNTLTVHIVEKQRLQE